MRDIRYRNPQEALQRLRAEVELGIALGYHVEISIHDAAAILGLHNVKIRTYEEMKDYTAPRQGNADGRPRIAGTDRLHPGDVFELVRLEKK